jgi:uncharacterized protein (TIGR03083 family)
VSHEWIVDTLDETWRLTDQFLRPQTPAAYDAPTACPGWSVRDVLSHLLGFELLTSGRPVPHHEGEWPEHVKNPIGELNEAFVESYRSRPGLEILDEYRDARRRSLDELRRLDDAGWEKVGWSPEGDRPYHRFMETRILDCWIHLQDLRDALGAPREDPGAGAEVVLNRFESALPWVVGKKMGAPDGTVVRLNLTGARGRSVAVAVRERRAEALAVTEEPPTLEVTVPTGLFWRRAAGRVSASTFLEGAQVRGAPDLAYELGESLRMMI